MSAARSGRGRRTPRSAPAARSRSASRSSAGSCRSGRPGRRELALADTLALQLRESRPRSARSASPVVSDRVSVSATMSPASFEGVQCRPRRRRSGRVPDRSTRCRRLPPSPPRILIGEIERQVIRVLARQRRCCRRGSPSAPRRACRSTTTRRVGGGGSIGFARAVLGACLHAAERALGAGEGLFGRHVADDGQDGVVGAEPGLVERDEIVAR